MSKRPSLAESMGADAAGIGAAMTLSNLPQILGNAMPELPRDAVGRHRLMRALRQRFGANFRSLPGISNLMSEFDGEISHQDRMAQLARITPKRG